MKHQCKHNKKSLKTLMRLVGVFCMCYLQGFLATQGIPEEIILLLWMIYVAQILILSNRLFGIRLETIKKCFDMFAKYVSSKGR